MSAPAPLLYREPGWNWTRATRRSRGVSIICARLLRRAEVDAGESRSAEGPS
jgi:hypothetical protein